MGQKCSSSGAQSEAPRRSWKLGHQQHPGPEDQESQHKLNEPRLDNPRASYRAQNPTNPKTGQKYQPDIQIPPTVGDRKNTPKIPEKYPKNTNFVFFEHSRGYLKGYFGESHVLYVGGYFCMSLAFLFCSWSRGCQTQAVFPRRGISLL